MYHYTSIAAFCGMIRNKEFWLGSMANMNDSAEITNFTDELCKALISDLPQQQSQIQDFQRKLSGSARKSHIFAMCLSKLEDNAAQWERYADGAKGVCIEFDMDSMYEVMKRHSMVKSEVFYEFDVRKHEHFRILKDYNIC